MFSNFFKTLEIVTPTEPLPGSQATFNLFLKIIFFKTLETYSSKISFLKKVPF